MIVGISILIAYILLVLYVIYKGFTEKCRESEATAVGCFYCFIMIFLFFVGIIVITIAGNLIVMGI